MQINENITKLDLRHRVEEWVERATLTLSTLGGGYQPGQEVSVSVGGQDRPFLVEGLGKRLLPGGLAQELSLLSSLSKEARRSPGKTQLFLTLTTREYEEFQAEYGGKEDSLEFSPLIRLGNAFGEKGWDSNSIIQVLAGLLGVKVHTGLPAYWVKQFTVKPSATFLGAILELVSPLKPILYSVKGEVFIVPEVDMGRSTVSGNALDLQGVRMVGEEVKGGNVSAKAGRLRLMGNLGEFRKEKYKGYTTPNPFSEWSAIVGNLGVSFSCYGMTSETFRSEVGNDPGYGGYYEYDKETGIVHNYTLDEVTKIYGLDVFGKKAFEVGELRTIYKYRVSGGLGRVIFRREAKITAWSATHSKFQSPQESIRRERIDQMVWYPAENGAVYGLYPNLESKTTVYLYYDNGQLLTQSMTKEGAVYTEGEEEYRPLGSMAKDDVSASGEISKKIIETEHITYTQHSRDSYGVRRIRSRMGRDGKYTTESDVQIVQAGAVQGSPVEFRKMQVYAEKGIGSEGPMKSPALEVAVNTPSWESLETILPLLEEELGHDEVVRTYEVFGELNAALGLQVDMPAFSSLDGAEAISSPGLASVPIVVGYEIEKDAFKGTALTRLTVKGRLA